VIRNDFGYKQVLKFVIRTEPKPNQNRTKLSKYQTSPKALEPKKRKNQTETEPKSSIDDIIE